MGEKGSQQHIGSLSRQEVWNPEHREGWPLMGERTLIPLLLEGRRRWVQTGVDL